MIGPNDIAIMARDVPDIGAPTRFVVYPTRKRIREQYMRNFGVPYCQRCNVLQGALDAAEYAVTCLKISVVLAELLPNGSYTMSICRPRKEVR